MKIETFFKEKILDTFGNFHDSFLLDFRIATSESLRLFLEFEIYNQKQNELKENLYKLRLIFSEIKNLSVNLQEHIDDSFGEINKLEKNDSNFRLIGENGWVIEFSAEGFDFSTEAI